MVYKGFDVTPSTWSQSSTTTNSGKNDNDNLLNDIFKTLGDLVNDASPIFFLNSIKNFQTAIEDFGHGMQGALACVSIDLQVVASGLSSAAIAYGATDQNIKNTFAQLDTQLGYYTNTAVTPNTLPQPTAAAQSALNTAYQNYNSHDTSSSSDSHLVRNIAIGAAVVVVVVVVVVVAIVAAPIEAIGAGIAALAGGLAAVF